MGHANVRVYVDKAMEGVGSFAAAIHMPHAFRPNSPSTLIPVDQHIRYIREIRAGEPVTMTGCVLAWDDTSVLLYQDMRHSDGRPAAAFRTRLVHAEAKSGRPFSWSSRSQIALAALIDTPPDDTAPRSLVPEDDCLPTAEANMQLVDSVGAPEIGRGLVLPQHCDVHGRMQASWFMSRISDSVPNLLHDWRQSLSKGTDGLRVGAAVLEYRLVYRHWPRTGDRLVVHSGLADSNARTHGLVHWILDPDTGLAYVTSQAVAVTFNLDTRKVIPMPDGHLKELKRIAPTGLRV